ncbi:Somatotropin [Dissostichus eleginoides]|uniref:Somatotropin n=1 Tax=Dissostichus eleginoides TaxID=100907 RepID=A0AAD9B3U5_DISEL|nr:Somatotropin [Dissostichus eleginoides]
MTKPITESHRLFSIAMLRVQNLHLLSHELLSEFVLSVCSDWLQELSVCSDGFQLLTLCSDWLQELNVCSDWLQVLNLLSISLRLVESWEFPSRSLPVGSRNLISPKLTELKTGIQLLMKANQDAAEMFADGSPLPLAPTGNYYQSSSMRRTYELLSCFKKDMHKV